MDLMKHNENRGTQEFIDIMSNVRLLTVISIPTTITSSTNSFVVIIIIITMVISKCYFSREHIALSNKKTV